MNSQCVADFVIIIIIQLSDWIQKTLPSVAWWSMTTASGCTCHQKSGWPSCCQLRVRTRRESVVSHSTRSASQPSNIFQSNIFVTKSGATLVKSEFKPCSAPGLSRATFPFLCFKSILIWNISWWQLRHLTKTVSSFQRLILLPDNYDDLSENCQHLLYLQLRQDHIEGVYRAEVSLQLSAAATAVHAEFGNYCSEVHATGPYFLPQHYLPDNVRLVKYFSRKNFNQYSYIFILEHCLVSVRLERCLRSFTRPRNLMILSTLENYFVDKSWVFKTTDSSSSLADKTRS